MKPLIRRAIEAAGLPTTGFVCEPFGGPAVNLTYLIRFDDGGRFVVRVYRWPFDGPDDLERPVKDAWLSEVLQRHGVPAARVLSTVETDDGTAAVRTFLPGDPLGDVPSADDGWRSAGEALARVHELEVGADAGVIAGRRVRPFAEGSWGRWQVANAVAHSEQVASRGTYRGVDPARIRTIYERAVSLLDERPVRLLHNDAHAWNVLVAREGDTWRCTGWLDWEFAWAGDPAWDLARLDIFRLKDIGVTPRSFYEGYGSGRVPVVSGLYELAIMLWMSNQAATGDETLLPTYERAHRHLLEAPAILAELEHGVDKHD